MAFGALLIAIGQSFARKTPCDLPKGELIFGVKIEDTYADLTVDATLAS